MIISVVSYLNISLLKNWRIGHFLSALISFVSFNFRSFFKLEAPFLTHLLSRPVKFHGRVKGGMKKKFKQCAVCLKIQAEHLPNGVFVQVYVPPATGSNQQIWPHSKASFSWKSEEKQVVLPSFCLCFSATSLFYGQLATKENLKRSAFCCTALGTVLCFESRTLKISKN